MSIIDSLAEGGVLNINWQSKYRRFELADHHGYAEITLSILDLNQLGHELIELAKEKDSE